MEKRMKNRVALLGILLIAGLLMAGIGTAFGAGTVFQGIEKEVRAVMTGNQVTIYEDGRVIQNLTLSEGEKYTWETSGISGGAIYIHKMTKEEMEHAQAERSVEMSRLVEIAKKDNRVQELIKGKNYIVVGTGIDFSNLTTINIANEPNEYEMYDLIVPHEAKERKGIVTLEVEGKYYKVTIDLNSETVESVEEQSSSRT